MKKSNKKLFVNNIYKRLMKDIGINTWIAIKKHYAESTGAIMVERQLCDRIRNQAHYGCTYGDIKKSLLDGGLWMVCDSVQFQ